MAAAGSETVHRLSANDSDDDGTKLLAIFVLGIGSLVSGLIPVFWTRQRSRPGLISLLLCFGAGVLLATALVHMLPEVRQMLPKYAEVIFCAGYFLIYAVEELVQSFPTYSSGGGGEDDGKEICARFGCCSGDSMALISRSLSSSASQSQVEISSPSADSGTEAKTGTFSLLLALCVHALLEGLAIGVQTSAAKVLLLLGAVSAHKFVVAFCLGVEVSSQQGSRRGSSLVQIVIFSLGSVCGIAIGMALGHMDETFNQLVIPALQAIAGGTLLYVTVSEVLPRERSKKKFSEMSGILQLMAVICGFALMSFLSMVILES